jgi:hypothetical protein
MNTVDGATIEQRIRINQLDDEKLRCKISRARAQPGNFFQLPQPSTTSSTSNAISSQQGHTEPSVHRRCCVISTADSDEAACHFQQRDKA